MVPAASGAYRLYREGAVILIGIALDLRAALAEHREGRHACTRGATAFGFEVSPDPVALQRKWLSEHARSNAGNLPECNGRRKPS